VLIVWNRIQLVCAVVVLCIALPVFGVTPPAGTAVDNQAQATFESPTGQRTVPSNTVHVVTQRADGLTLLSDRTVTAASGASVTFAHRLTNTGNSATDYTISALNQAGDDFDFSSISVYVDSNSNGVLDAAEPQLLTGATISVPFGGSADLLIVATLPANVQAGRVAKLQITAKSTLQSISASNIDAATVAAGSAPPVITYFGDGTFAHAISVTQLGLPLWIQATASACNADPLTVETRAVRLTASLSGDSELFVGTETGLNTGIFRVLPNVPTRDASASPVVAGNGFLELRKNDVVTAAITGCGSASANILIDPSGVLFDSHTNQPVENATVTLIDVSGDGNGGKPNQPAIVIGADGVTPASATVLTGPDGRYEFLNVLPSQYRLSIVAPNGYVFPSTVVSAQLPAGHNIDPQGSYGGNFRVTADGPVTFDVPLDPGVLGGLFLQKQAVRQTVEVGEYLDYTITVRNTTGRLLTNLQLEDDLPAGFVYQAHTARLNGAVIADPIGGGGPRLTFAIASLDTGGSDQLLTYRVRILPAALKGDATNRARAFNSIVQSNTATVKVQLREGVFSDRGYVLGKVFLDCNGNHMQDAGEMGVPGIRLYMEDGTFVVTDNEGRYSFYGVSARTHVVKLDNYSLPAGSHLVPMNTRNVGDSGSQFAYVMNGQIERADFALDNCSDDFQKVISARKNAAEGKSLETVQALKQTFIPERIEKSDAEIKGAGASGFVGGAATPGQAQTVAIPAGKLGAGAKQTNAEANAAAPPEPPPLETMLRSLGNELGFTELKDHDTLPYTQATVRVKGRAGTTFKLWVNQVEVGPKQVGKKTVLPSADLEAWEFVGVNFKPGENFVRLAQVDPFGNVRDEREIRVIAPNKLGKLKIIVPPNGVTADGKTPVKVRVLLTDSKGVPVTVRTPVTLDSSVGEWQVKDLDPNEPGIQVFIENGSAEFTLIPAMEPGQATIRATTGALKSEAQLDMLPELRPMIAAGVMEMSVNLSNGVSAPGSQNGFEQKLNLFSASNSDSTVDSGTRAAMFMKGRIPGDNLLTFAYDSEKTSRDRLFRDIQPDEFFPVYGDSSLHGYDAQSTGKTYLRVDHGKSYALFGDYLTNDTSTQPNQFTRNLGSYSRSMNGTKDHFENGRVSITGFASRDTMRQIVDEIRADGTSGPYQLSNPDGVENSEKVEIIVRDRNQPAIILDTQPMTRFTDYEFEPFTGRLLFKAPVSSYDQFFNPVSIRVTYEANQGGEKFWVGGIDTRLNLTNKLMVGGIAVEDDNPLDASKLFSLNSAYQFADKTKLTAEVAQTRHMGESAGLGYRFEFQHKSDRIDTKAYFGRTEATFDNPTAMLAKGRGEAGVKFAYKFTDSYRFLAEALRTEDVTNGGTRTGLEAAMERTFTHNLQVRLGYRHAQETTAPATETAVGNTPNDTDSLFGRVSVQVPGVPKASVNAEYEQDVLNSEKRRAEVGATYQIFSKGKVYVRHELISSLDSVYSLNPNQSQNTTQIGLETDARPGTHVFSEYRTRNVLNTAEAEAALGLRNIFQIRKGFALSTGIENVRTLAGASNDSIAVTSAVDYTASETWRASARMEWRGSATTYTVLNTLGFAAAMNKEWTFLARNVVSDTINRAPASGDHTLDRFQTGFAYRDNATNRWNALGMIELKADDDNTQLGSPVRRQSVVFSGVTDFKASPTLLLSSRWAAKIAADDSNGLRNTSIAQLFSSRATYQFARKWDVSFTGSSVLTHGSGWGEYGLGTEIGYALMKNVWLSSGYNVFGYRDQDLTGDDVTRRGAFMRLRFKFDENIFKPKGEQQ
jgi:uncharacterized repeat protein (TIGR01451 family)